MSHPWTNILSKLVSRFESIINVGSPVAAGTNVLPPQQLSVQSSGDFTGTARKQYRVQITTAGISGAAKCTITDITSGSDTVASPVTITTNVAINLGLLGGRITFTFATGEALTLGDKWTVTCDTFNVTMRKVLLARAVPVELDPLPGIVLAISGQNYGAPDGEKYGCILNVVAEGWIQEDHRNIQTLLPLLIEDMEHSIAKDPTLDGTVEDISFTRCDPVLPVEGRPFGAVSLEMAVHFNQIIN